MPVKRKIHPVRPLDSVSVPASPEDRDALEADALRRLDAALPADMRAALREALDAPDWNTRHAIWGVPGNPEAADLLTIVYAIRHARRDDEALQRQRELATLHAAPVTLALLPASRRVDCAAVVIRRGGGRGENIIVFAAEPLSSERVAHALRHLASSRVTDGEFPRADVRIEVAGQTPAPSVDEHSFATAIVHQLMAAQPRPVPGLGVLPAIQIEVGPVTMPPLPC